MKRSDTSRVAIIAILAAVFAATMILAVLQFRWSAAAAQREGNRIRTNLELRARSIVGSVNREMWYAVDLLREVVRDPEFDAEALRAALDEWETNARFPRLISEVIVVRRGREGDDEGRALYWAGNEIQETDIRGAQIVDERYFLRDGTTEIDNDRIATGDFTVITRAPGEEPNGIGIAHIDRGVLFSTVFPALTDDAEIGLILRDPQGNALVRLGDTGDREADIRVPVRLVSLSPPVERRPGGTANAVDSLNSFTTVTERYFSDTAIDDPRNHDERQQYSLDVFRPESSIDRFIVRQRRSNLLVSWGVLAVELAALAAAVEMYRRTNRLRRREQEFVALMSHELRTPLSLITTAAENLSTGYVVKPDRVGEYAEMIGRHAARLNTMVDSILTYARMSAGETATGNTSPVRPLDVIRNVAEELGPTAAAAAARIDLSIEHDPGELCIDGEGFRAVLSNLLRNALIHGVGGLESLPDEEERIVQVRVESASPECYSVDVLDWGLGIPSREQKSIFDPFVRGRRSVDRHVRGSGLGLYLVRTIVAGMGGTVRLESPIADDTHRRTSPGVGDGPGTRVVLTLPLTRCTGGSL
jgi:signal transduction histidine kinase